MPVITFLQYVSSLAKGPYHRLVGRHSQRYCQLAFQKAGSECRKNLLTLAAVSADEVVADMLGLSSGKDKNIFEKRPYGKISKNQATRAMRVYTSALLVLLGNKKELLLEKAALSERELLDFWCRFFEYQPADMQVFDQILLTSVMEGGVPGLAETVAKTMAGILFPVPTRFSKREIAALEDVLLADAARIILGMEKPGREGGIAHV